MELHVLISHLRNHIHVNVLLNIMEQTALYVIDLNLVFIISFLEYINIRLNLALDQNACSSNPCLFNGQCLTVGNTYTCVCLPGFHIEIF